jgi:hypothetical protein
LVAAASTKNPAMRLPSVRIRDDPAFHIFRQIAPSGRGGMRVMVSDALRRRLEKEKPALRHIEFAPLYAGL